MCNRNHCSWGNSFSPLLYVKGKILHTDIVFLEWYMKKISSQMRRTFRLFSAHKLLKQSLMLLGEKQYKQVQRRAPDTKLEAKTYYLWQIASRQHPVSSSNAIPRVKETVTKLFNVCNRRTSKNKKKCSTGRECRRVPLATEKQQSEEQT